MFNYEEFKAELVRRLTNLIGEHGIANIEVSTEFTPAVSGIEERLNVKRIGSKCAQSIKLRPIYEEYAIKDLTVQKIAEDLFGTLNKNFDEQDRLSASVEQFADYEWVKDRLALFALPLYSGTKKNYPTIKMGSIELGVRVCVSRTEEGMSTFAVDKKMLKHYGVSKAKLFEDASKATNENFKMEVITLAQAMARSIGLPEEDGLAECIDGSCPPAYLARIDMGVGGIGAAAIAYKDFFKKMEKLSGGDFYVIPSSIDEVIIFPAKAAGKEPQDRAAINGMLRNTNEECVPKNKVLAEYAMFYDVSTGSLEIVKELEEAE